jgi:anti-anti-sigma regulatory factor
MPAHPGNDRRPQIVRARDRSQQLAAKSRQSRRSRSTAPRPEVQAPPPPAGLEIRLANWEHAISIELCGDLTAENSNRLSDCLEHALQTPADRVILDLGGLDRLDHEAVSPILIAHLIAESEHRQLLLIPGTADVQRVVDQVQGPFSYISPSDCSAQRTRAPVLDGGTSRPSLTVLELRA